MIRGINGQGSLVVSGGAVGSTYYQTGQSMSGMVRYHNNNLEVFDGTTWYIIQSTYTTVGLNAEAELAIDWVKKKMREEETLISLPNDHPAVKAAKENVNRAKQALKEAEEQLKVTMILSEDQ